MWCFWLHFFLKKGQEVQLCAVLGLRLRLYIIALITTSATTFAPATDTKLKHKVSC